MTTTPAMPELPEPELGYIKTDKSNHPAFSARQIRAAMQSAQPAEVSDDGLISKDRFYGDDHVQDIAHALAQECEQAELDPNDFVTVNREKLVAIAARVLEKASAILALRPQAVPMTEPVKRLSRYAGQTMRTARNPNITAREAIEIGDYLAAIGITQRADAAHQPAKEQQR